MDKPTANIVIIGHVDHGKSTLIGRLLFETRSLPKGRLQEIRDASRELNKTLELAFLVDQLKEERQLERSIETTQVSLRTAKRDYVLIDAPGHAEFITNMLTGASRADAALLIVDASEGIKDQTRRHAYLIKLLGIEKVIVALNKMDLIKYQRARFEAIKKDLLRFLGDLPLTPFSIIPISAKKGENVTRPSLRMKWNKESALLETLNRLILDKKKQIRPLRFCVQDIYPSGKENIAVGKVISGSIQNGQHVKVLPSLRKTKVNQIRIYGINRKIAQAGENIGLSLEDMKDLKRGDIIADGNNFPKPLRTLKSTVFWLSEEPLRLNQSFLLRLATQEVECVAKKIERPIDSATLKTGEEKAKELKSNQAATVTLLTKKPLVAENFSFIDELGRFVIERENRLQGLGIVSNL